MLKYLICSKKGVSVGKGRYRLPKKGELLWLVVAGSDNKEINRVVNDFSLDEKIIREYGKVEYSKRVSSKPFQFVFVDPAIDRGKIVKTKNLFVVGKEFIIIFSKDKNHYSEFFDIISEEIRHDSARRRVSYVVYRLLEEDVEENYDILKTTEKRINDVEDSLIKQRMNSPRQLILVKRDLFYINKVLLASTKVIFNIKNGLVPIKLDQADKLILEDTYHTLLHQVDVIFSQKEMLTDLLEIYVSNISNNLNKVMKTLTALTVVIAVPTLISGIYGMNFKYIPLAQPVNGFYIMLGIIAVIALALSYYFYKRGWI